MVRQYLQVIVINSISYADLWFGIVPGRVRVAVRLRPRNAEELVADADFADCVELQPEVVSIPIISIL